MSEIAKVKLQIDLETEAAQRALYDPAIVADHASITTRMERLADHIAALEHAGLHQIAHDVLCQDSLWKLRKGKRRCLRKRLMRHWPNCLKNGKEHYMSTELARPSKLRFYPMCVAAGITQQELYFKTLVNPNLIECAFVGIEIPLSAATQLVNAFNDMAHTHYQVNDFSIKLHHKESVLL